ncbi:MAG: AAA family ATPase [Syntrophales bacterium]
MYNEFYGFSGKPFEITPDTKFLYLTSSHRKALDAMIKGIESRQGSISITGEVGTGKTTLIHYLLMNLDNKVRTAFIFHPSITFKELLEIILRELDLEVTGKDKKDLLHDLVEYLLHVGNDETVAVIIDEAQNISKETLQELEKLSDLGPLASGRLQIVFVGQLEFENMLSSPNLKILNQRIKIRSKITTLTAEESREYIEHRLKIVESSTSKVFTPKAISIIIEHANGIPRVINIVCDNALLNGFSESKKKIDAKIIREVIKNLEGPSHRAFMPIRIFRFVKRTNLIRHKRNLTPRIMAEYNSNPSIHILDFISQRQISVIFLFLLGLVVIVFLIWTFLFHNESSIIIAPQSTSASNSEVDNHYPSVDTVAVPIESPKHVTPPSASSIPLNKEAISIETIIVKKGQSISLLAKKYYGMSNRTCTELILDYNPEITNIHIIAIGQKIKIPKVTEERLIIQSSDHTYKIHVGTFRNLEFARLYRGEPSLRGKEIKIVDRKVTSKERWYRVIVGKFNSEDDALKVISILRDKKLLPLFTAEPKMQ